MPAQQYEPMIAGDLPEEFAAEEAEEQQRVGVHRAAWQFAKMVIGLGVVIGIIALVTSLPHMSKKAEPAETIDSKSVVGLSAAVPFPSDECTAFQGVGHLSIDGACCAAGCGHYCGASNCQAGPPGYKACCATFFKDAEGNKLYCGNGQMAPCWVTTTTTAAPTKPPPQVVKGDIVASTASNEESLRKAADSLKELACRQALTGALGQEASVVKVSKVHVMSSGDDWAGGGFFKFAYEITAEQNDKVFSSLLEPTTAVRQSITDGLNKAFTDLNIDTVVSGVTIPQPALHAATSV